LDKAKLAHHLADQLLARLALFCILKHGNPHSFAFDGGYIWVTNSGDNTVTQLRATDGLNVGSFRVGNTPRGVAFDGASIWVANEGSNTGSKL
jgi:DNA-binding beta-propeller fold protein YncE